MDNIYQRIKNLLFSMKSLSSCTMTKNWIEVRQHLHQHPELGMNEFQTQRFLIEQLGSLANAAVQSIGETGLLVTFQGKDSGKTTLFRGDIDALPIEEKLDVSYRSRTEGVSHKCGHDGHTTILLSLAHKISSQPPLHGTVHLLFQPSEENGKGARAVLNDTNWTIDHLDFCFALHNLPGFPLHQVACKTGTFTSAVTSWIAKVKGYTAHAAEPWNAANPSTCITQLHDEALKLNFESEDHQEYVTVVPVHIILGSKDYGITPGYGEIHFTIRAHSTKALTKAVESLHNKATTLVQKPFEVQWEEVEPFDANENNTEAVEHIVSAAQQLKLDFNHLNRGFRWGEDFGLFTQKYPGAMFGLGAGEECLPLHHPDYDFPDDLIPTGAEIFFQIFQNIHRNG